MSSFQSIFGIPPDVTLTQEIARAVLIFIYVLFLLRIAGPRTFAKFSGTDAVTSIIVGSSLSRALTGNSPLLGTLAAIAAFVLLHWLVTQGNARSIALSRIFEGKPIELAANGEIHAGRMRSKGVSSTDIEEAARLAGYTDVRAARQVTLEPSGRITVCPQAPE